MKCEDDEGPFPGDLFYSYYYYWDLSLSNLKEMLEKISETSFKDDISEL